MDGGDGAGNTGGTSDGGAGVIGFGGMGTPPMFGGSGTSGIGGKNKPFSPQTVPSWHRTAAGAPGIDDMVQELCPDVSTAGHTS